MRDSARPHNLNAPIGLMRMSDDTTFSMRAPAFMRSAPISIASMFVAGFEKIPVSVTNPASIFVAMVCVMWML